MSEPPFSIRLTDWFFLRLNTGIRVRYWIDPHGIQQRRIQGDVNDKRYGRFLRFIDEFVPEGEGTVDARSKDNRIVLRVNGSIKDAAYEQRLRNMLLNL
jgi:hypothetical protein